jgi:hypothetical protein
MTNPPNLECAPTRFLTTALSQLVDRGDQIQNQIEHANEMQYLVHVLDLIKRELERRETDTNPESKWRSIDIEVATSLARCLSSDKEDESRSSTTTHLSREERSDSCDTRQPIDEDLIS